MADDQQELKIDNFSELGASGLWRTGGFVIDDILPQLRGKQAQTAYRDMSENDPIIGAMLFAIERVILQVDWRIDPYDDPTGNTPNDDDVAAAQFVEECMNDMSHSWHELMIAILSFLPYGWSYFEIVYKQRKGPDQKDPSKRSKFKDNKIGWRKIAMRTQDSLWQWQFDESGGIKAMIQRDPTTGRLNVIPIEKALLFRTTTARGNPEGRSVLRNAFKSWYYKRRIEEFEAVGVERDLAGLPVAYVPPEWMSQGATPGEKAALGAMERIVRGVKRNETEGIILPAIYDEQGKQLVDFKLLNSGGARQFNAQPLDAKVLTPSGWKRMGDIAVGDVVVDPLGLPSHVTGVFPKGVRPVYRVTTADGRSTLADAEHNWVVTNSKWRNSENINDAHPLLPNYKVRKTQDLLANIEKHGNGRRFHLPLIEPVEYVYGDPLPVEPYVLGVLLGDGHLREDGGVRFYSADAQIAQEVESHLPAGDVVTMWHDKDGGSGKAEMYHITGTSGRRTSAVKTALSEMSLLGKKAPEKFVPRQYLTAGVKDRLALLQGLMDTDGTITNEGLGIFYTVSPQLASDVAEIVRSLGGTASVGRYPIGEYTSPKTGKVGFSANEYHHVRIRMPQHLPMVRLERKAEKLSDDSRMRYHTGISSVEYVGEMEVQCIMVSSPSHMYVTDDFIPTHNTDQIITRYNQHIAMTVLADFIMLGHESVGSFALGTSKVDLFVASVESWVRLIAEVFNSHAIPRLMNLNGYPTDRLPQLTYGQIAAIDLQELGAFLLNLANAQMITPDNNLEEYLRELAGLPNFRPETDGTTPNQRYGDLRTAQQAQTMSAIHNGDVTLTTDQNGPSATPTGASTQDNTVATAVQNPVGGLNDLSGGSGIQANITSSGYSGDAPPNLKPTTPGKVKSPTTNTSIKRPPSGMSGPLVNNQGPTS